MWTKRGNTHADEEYAGNIDCFPLNRSLIFSGPVDPAHVPLSEYVKNMVIDQEVLNLTDATELNTDLLDVNAIPPEQNDIWFDAQDEDPDCHIIEDPRANVPAKTPPPEEPRPGDLEVEIFNMHP
jgi:hypothetical protein